MIKRLVKNGVFVNSCSSSGSIRSLYWEEIKPKSEESINMDITDSNYDIDAYLKRKEERDQGIVTIKPQKNSEEVIIDFETNSFDSEDEQAFLQKEWDEHDEDEKNNKLNQSKWNLISKFQKENALSCAVTVGNSEVIEFLIEQKANPFQHSSAALRAVSDEHMIDALKQIKDTERGEVTLQVSLKYCNISFRLSQQVKRFW